MVLDGRLVVSEEIQITIEGQLVEQVEQVEEEGGARGTGAGWI